MIGEVKGGAMLFSPERILEIALRELRINPDHAEGIILGLIAAEREWETMIAQASDQVVMPIESDANTAPLEPLENRKPEKVSALPRR